MSIIAYDFIDMKRIINDSDSESDIENDDKYSIKFYKDKIFTINCIKYTIL